MVKALFTNDHATLREAGKAAGGRTPLVTKPGGPRVHAGREMIAARWEARKAELLE